MLTVKVEFINPDRASQDNPRVYYLNLPKRFVAGTVYDPAEKEVVIGTNVILTDNNDKKSYIAKTDDFGDFEFEGLPVSKFTMVIAKGKKSEEIKVNAEKTSALAIFH